MKAHALLTVLVLVSGICQAQDVTADLPENVTRPWVGPAFWATDSRLRVDGWQLNQGRIECLDPGKGEQLHLLTHELLETDGLLEMTVRMGRLNQNEGFAGFIFAVTGVENEYRANMYVNKGLLAGLTDDGHLRIADAKSPGKVSQKDMQDLLLKLRGDCKGSKARVTLQALKPDGKTVLVEYAQDIEKDPLAGNLALTCEGKMRSWFSDWHVSGSKVAQHPERAFGPILWTQYTLHNRTLKMTAFMGALSARENAKVTLEIQRDGEWATVDTARIRPLGSDSDWRSACPTAHLRVDCWDDTRDIPYRVAYEYKTAQGTRTDRFAGTIRRDPADKPVIKLCVITGMGHVAWPNHHLQANLLAHDPDVAFFSGDNIYGGSYAMFGWAFRDLLRDRPSVCTPDDHDVGANDLWGRGGELRPEGQTRSYGGYRHSLDFINRMHRMQTAHLPDPWASAPSKNAITVYYTSMTYGRIGFGIIDDRHFKSAPGQALDKPVGHDNFNNMEKVKAERGEYDTKQLDKPGLELLGEGQLDFLNNWAADWRGTDMKMVLHQSPFCQSANYGGGLWPPDLDTNGWPQTPRNQALRTIRKGFAAMASGDTHLGMLMQMGVENWGDASWEYVCPAGGPVSNRSWNPGFAGENHQEGMPEYTGDYTDAFGNKMTVWAVSNPGTDFARTYREPDGSQVDILQKRVAGYGIIDMDKKNFRYTFHCYPVYNADVDPRGKAEYPGWPKTAPLESNFGYEPRGYLPTLRFPAGTRPAIQVIQDKTGQVVYARRLGGKAFRPPVFGEGTYSVVVGEVGTTDVTILHHLQPTSLDQDEPIEVPLHEDN